MLFSDRRFPEDISYGAIGGPEFSTSITNTKNGYEARNINWNDARIRYNVSHGIKTEKQLSILIAFFRLHQGKALGFRFKDWIDYKATGVKIGIGNNTQTSFQLIKHYFNVSRTITKPVKDTVKIFVDNTEVNNGYNINYQTGILTFKQAPKMKSTITANFEFDVPARFDTDVLLASIDTSNTYSWKNIHIVEIKLR